MSNMPNKNPKKQYSMVFFDSVITNDDTLKKSIQLEIFEYESQIAELKNNTQQIQKEIDEFNKILHDTVLSGIQPISQPKYEIGLCPLFIVDKKLKNGNKMQISENCIIISDQFDSQFGCEIFSRSSIKNKLTIFIRNKFGRFFFAQFLIIFRLFHLINISQFAISLQPKKFLILKQMKNCGLHVGLMIIFLLVEVRMDIFA
jgi:hypothetical protein